MDSTRTGDNDRLARVSKETEKPVAVDPFIFCPNCSTQLVDHRCKLKCPQIVRVAKPFYTQRPLDA